MNSQSAWKVAVCAIFHRRHHVPIMTFSTPSYCIVDECQKCGCQQVSYTVETAASVEKKLCNVLSKKIPD